LLGYLGRFQPIGKIIKSHSVAAALPLLLGVLLGGAAVYFSEGASEKQRVQAALQQVEIEKQRAEAAASQVEAAEVAREDLQRKLTQWEGDLKQLKDAYAKERSEVERASDLLRTENASLKAKMAKMQKLLDDRKRPGAPQDRK
jgi:ABC-type phosphate transport system auxiliary subunit